MNLKVLVVDSDGETRRTLVHAFEAGGCVVAQSATAADARSRVEGFAYDALVLDVRLSDGDGLDILDEARTRYPALQAVVTTSFASIHHAVRALKGGALDYLSKPVDPEQVLATLKARTTTAPAVASPSEVPASNRAPRAIAHNIVGDGPAMQKLFTTLERVAPLNSTVLIQGETGTGKELVARTIHTNSPRREHAFVAFNAAAIPDGLAEAELFGHVKGAFTGAVYTRVGRFEAADRGTLFIDEVASMSQGLQAKLLRALQEREIERVGSSRPMKINTRVVAASNVDLAELVRRGDFREDLFYRLNVINVSLPALRNRREDIPALARYFVTQACEDNDLAVKSLGQSTLQRLMEFHWPGNVRHLQNAVEHSVAMSGQNVEILPDTLPDELSPATSHITPVGHDSPLLVPATPDEGIHFATAMTHVERELILRYLRRAGGNKRQAARLLNMSRTTLIDKLHRLGVTEDIVAEARATGPMPLAATA